MKKLYLILIVAMCTLQLSAQDKVTLKWQVDDVNKPKSLTCYAIGDFTVNWGDGITETPPTYGGMLSHTYDSTGEYEVVITASNTDCKVAWVDCCKEQVTELSFFDCPYLAMLQCSDNMITNLNLSGYVHLSDLECEDNLLTNLDLSGCIDLKYLFCENNQITNLNLSGCDSLEWLYCENNQITNINLTGCFSLTFLHCENNKITNLDLSDCTALERFFCDENQITSLDLSNCLVLEYLSCENNLLTGFDLSNFGIIKYLHCSNNQIKLLDLYATQLVVNNYIGTVFGTQNLPIINANMNTELFEDQSVINGVYTEYSVRLDGALAPQSNYTVKEGKLIFLEEGKYTVTMTNKAIVSNDNDLAKVIVPVEVVPVGISENSILQIEVYPNPTTGKLKIENGELRIENVEIYDVYGRNLTLHTSYLLPHTSLDLSNLKAGVYFVKINTDAGIVTKKIIKH